jgi:hypothetical protein
MRAIRLSIAVIIVASAFVPLDVNGQTLKENPDDFVKDVVMNLFGPNWNLGLSAGNNNHGRFLLQRATLAGGATGERTLRAQDGFSVGFLAGVDLFLRMGVRFGYTYGNSDLVFRTDIGDDTDILDGDDLGELENHTISVELMRYLLPSTASITPYASAGFIGTWYVLEDGSGFATNGESTQFRTGALANLGLKVELSDRSDLRLEGATASVRNPFTGRDSYRIPTGITVDEPTRVTRSNLRVAAVYNFGRPDPNLPTARRAGRTGKR